MVIDNPMNEKGQARRRYLVYDLVAINGESVVEVGTFIIPSLGFDIRVITYCKVF